MATAITLRAIKGSPLSIAEHDANHANAANAADAAKATADAALAAATAGSAPTSVAYSTAIPLNLINGSDLGVHTVVSNEVLTVAGGAVNNGWAIVKLVGDGVHTPVISNFTNPTNFAFANAAGQVNVLEFAYLYGEAFVFGTYGAGAAPAANPPGQVTGLATGTITQTAVALTWAAPSSGGTPTTYVVQYRVSAGPGAWQTFSHAPSTALGITVTGLSPATQYDFHVAAFNADGTGTYSSFVTATTSAAATGQLSVGNGASQGDFTISALSGVDEYLVGNGDLVGSYSNPQGSKATAGNLIKGPGGWMLYGGATNGNAVGVCLVSWTDATQAANGAYVPAGNNNNSGYFFTTPGSVEAGFSIYVTADSTPRWLNIYLRTINANGNSGIKVRGQLSDGTPAQVSAAYTTGDTNVKFAITFNASTDGQTLRIDVFPSTLSAGAQIGFIGLAMGH